MRNVRKHKRQTKSDNNVRLHDSICDLVKQEFEKRGIKTFDHREYNAYPYSVCGEIDVGGKPINDYKRKYMWTAEIKYTNRGKNKNKANKQLTRAENYCPWMQGYRVFKFYAYHDDNSKGYTIEWIKHKNTKGDTNGYNTNNYNWTSSNRKC